MAGAGPLNSRVAIQRATTTYSETNQPLESWSTIATRWAEVKAVADAEVVKADRQQHETTYQVTMRTGFELLSTDRLLYGDVVMNIAAIIPQDNRLVITAVHVEGDE